MNFVSAENMTEIAKTIKTYADKSDDLHNILSGGRDLRTVLGVSTLAQAGAKLKQLSDKHDYALLKLGDWLDVPLNYGSGSVTCRYEIAAFDQYHWFWTGASGGTYGLGSITFLCTVIPLTRQIGTSVSQLVYFGSPMDTFLRGLESPLESALGAQLKQPVLYQQYNEGTYTDPSWYTDPDDYENDCNTFARKVFMPSARELTGEYVLGCNYGDNSHQFPLLALAPGKIPGKNTSGAYTYEWTRTPSRNPGRF